ncbi:MAG TPA: TIM barrel protein [Gemmataceae bacterium]|nr:TIM barrel protein [Gemmataceae bacterium]
MNTSPDRRTALQALGAGALAATVYSAAAADERPATKGRINQSVCKWCYSKLSLDKLAAEVKKIGYQSVELLVPQEFPTVKTAGLTCAILGGASIPDGLNRKENHEKIEKHLREFIDFASKEGIANVICMSGNRKGMPDDVGLENCVIGVKRVVGYAEEKKVTLCMEGLNSKVDHKDYMYDKTQWGVELCKRVGSERFKLLYDIYHMQIMEGDVIRTIKENAKYIAHYHTGGNPGRHEIDDTQELNYAAIAKAIAETGFKGFMAQEFIPVRDTVASLTQAFKICDV